jgi:transporter family-2 protein
VRELVLTAMSPHRHTSPLPAWLALVLAVLGGILMTVQARVNSELAFRIDNGFAAATISFGSGFAILCVIMLASRRARTGLRLVKEHIKAGSFPWVFTLSGAVGGGFVLSQGLVIGITGVALFTVAFIAGLAVGGLLLDLWGIGPAGRRHLSVFRVGGAALALVAVAIALVGQPTTTVSYFPLVLPAFFGVLVGWQQAANGRLALVSQSPWTATFLNFMVGTGVLLVALAIRAFSVSPSIALPTSLPSDPWLYIGGASGVIFIAIFALIVRSIGVLLMSLGSVAGQLVMALTLDVTFPAAHPLAIATVVGTILTLIAAGVAAIPRRHRASHSEHQEA